MSPELTARVLHGCVVVVVRGEVDFRSVPALEQYLSAVIAMQAPAIVLDLSRLAFIDCASLRAVLNAERQAAARGKSFALAAPRPIVARLLQVTGLDQRFIIFPAVEEAVMAPLTRHAEHFPQRGVMKAIAGQYPLAAACPRPARPAQRGG